MPQIFRIPKTGKEFEQIALKFLEHHFAGNWEVRGRSGQNQHGVDLLDRDVHPPVRAAQCKNGPAASTWTKIESDLRRAMERWPSLEEFFVLTTLEGDTSLQDEVAKSNATPGAAKIRLFDWSDIERWGNESQVGSATLLPVEAATLQHVGAGLASEQRIIQFERSLDDAEAQLGRGETREVAAHLDSLLRQVPSSSSSSLRSRALRLRARAASLLGDHERMIDCSLEAYQLLPTDAKAVSNAARALMVRGDTKEAKELAESAVSLDPHADYVWATRVLVEDALEEFDAVCARIPTSLRESEEVVTVRITHRDRAGLDDTYVDWAVQRFPQSATIAYHSACERKRAAIERACHRWPGRVSEDDFAIVSSEYERSARLAGTSGHVRLAAAAYVELADFADAAGVSDVADRAIDQARRLDYDWSPVRIALAKRGLRRDEGPSQIERWLADIDDPNADGIRVELLWRDPATRNESCDLLLESLPEATRTLHQSALIAERFAVCGRMREVAVLIEREPPHGAALLQLACALGQTSSEPGYAESVRVAAEEVVRFEANAEWPDLLVRAAGVLHSAGHHASAIACVDFLQANEAIEPYHAARLLLPPLIEAGEFGRAFAVAEAFKDDQAEVWNCWVGLLTRFDPLAALSELKRAAESCCLTPEGTLTLAQLALKNREPEVARDVLFGTDPRRLVVSLSNLSVSEGCALVRLLHNLNERDEAVEAAYELTRRFPRSGSATASLTHALVFDPENGGERAVPFSGGESTDSVGVHTAVRLTDESGVSRWAFIEHPLDGVPHREDEYAPESGNALKLLGKSVGDTISFSALLGFQRVETIAAILPSPVGRHLAGANLSPSAFDDDDPPTFVSISLDRDADGTPDITPLLEFGEASAAHAAQMEEAYQRRSIPNATVAHLLGRPAFLTALVRWLSPELDVHVALGTEDEAMNSERHTRNQRPVVIGPSAVATLVAIQTEALLLAESETHVPASLVEQLERERECALRAPVQWATLLFKHGPTAEEAESIVARLDAVIAKLRRCRVVSHRRAVAELPAMLRADLETAIDSTTLESIALAHELKGALWSDDLVTRRLVEAMVGVPTLCSIDVAHAQRSVQHRDIERAAFVMGAVACGGRFVRLTEDVVRRWLRHAMGDPDRLSPLVRYLEREPLPAITVSIVAMWALKAIWSSGDSSLVLPNHREFSHRVFGAVAASPHSHRALAAMPRAIQLGFGLEVVRAADVQQDLEDWRRRHPVG